MKKETNQTISWIEGKWGSNSNLSIPLQDRGLNFSDGIFETILILKRSPKLIFEHLIRWERSASILGMESPPNREWVIRLIEEGIHKTGIINGSVRINWSRGDNHNRGITMPVKTSTNYGGRFWLEINEHEPSFSNVSTIISQHERRNSFSRSTQCKTFAYNQAIQVRHEAITSGNDDGILLSTTGHLSCGSSSNLLIKRDGKWLTPNLRSGCLPGIMRQQGINKGIFQEAEIKETPLKKDQWMLINSLSCHPITQVGIHKLDPYNDAKSLWISLLT